MEPLRKQLKARTDAIYTFADKGMGVLTPLQRNTGKHYVGRVKKMEAFVFTKRNFEWLKAVFGLRHHLPRPALRGERLVVAEHTPLVDLEAEVERDHDEILHEADALIAKLGATPL